MEVKLTIGDKPVPTRSGKPPISSRGIVTENGIKGQLWDLAKRILKGEQGLVDRAEQYFELTHAERVILRQLEQQTQNRQRDEQQQQKRATPAAKPRLQLETGAI